MVHTNWIFGALLGAASLHVIEEYVYPGGFPDFMKRMFPSLAASVTHLFAIIINALFILLCIAAVLVGESLPLLSLSVAALCGSNALVHLVATCRTRRYVPGVVTGLILYLPLAILALWRIGTNGRITPAILAAAVMLGIAYQAIPLGTLKLTQLLKRRDS